MRIHLSARGGGWIRSATQSRFRIFFPKGSGYKGCLLDRSGNVQCGQDDQAGEIVLLNVIGMAQSLKLRVVGEGVETEEQVAFL